MKIKDKNIFDKINKILKDVTNRKFVLHLGGWKKLKDISVDKLKFNEELSEFLDMSKTKILDFYGMTEQLGTVYPDCEYGYKHAPLYSEIIIRDVDTFKPCFVGETGFIQLLSPIPHSYPGISIISDDIGELKGIDNCKCGRKGKYFVFKKRAEKAELKGCGDTYEQ
jgi:predicted house-cleaning noncanonical NTP pyrophosphatase (MazG superfamily)